MDSIHCSNLTYIHDKLANGHYIDEADCQRWFKDGLEHNENGPAVISPNNTKYWIQNGEYYREGGLPHIEWVDGVKDWVHEHKVYHSFEEYCLAKVMK